MKGIEIESRVKEDVCHSIEVLAIHSHAKLKSIDVWYEDVDEGVEYLFEFENMSDYPEIERDIIDLIDKFKDVVEV